MLVTGLALATLVLAEVAFRAFFPQLNPATQLVFYSQNPWQVPLGLPGETYRHRHNAGDFDVEVRFNALGLRDVADIRQARPRRLAVCGGFVRVWFRGGRACTGFIQAGFPAAGGAGV